MDGSHLSLVCHHCQSSAPLEACKGCTELRAAWYALGTSHQGREIVQPKTVALSGPGLVLTWRMDPLDGIIPIAAASFVIVSLFSVLFLSPKPGEIAPVLAVLIAVAVLGIVVSVRRLLHRVVLRLADGALTVTDRSKVTALRADAIAQLVVHATHTARTHRSALHTGLRCVLVARTPRGDVPLLTAPLQDLRFIESLIERQLWISDDPGQNALTTAAS